MKKNIKIYDNGGKTLDRYTIVFTDRQYYREGSQRDQDRFVKEALACNSEPFHGIGMHVSATCGRHLGKRITFEECPEQVQKFILQNMEDGDGFAPLPKKNIKQIGE
jgi:hypothetical protein